MNSDFDYLLEQASLIDLKILFLSGLGRYISDKIPDWPVMITLNDVHDTFVKVDRKVFAVIEGEEEYFPGNDQKLVNLYLRIKPYQDSLNFRTFIQDELLHLSLNTKDEYNRYSHKESVFRFFFWDVYSIASVVYKKKTESINNLATSGLVELQNKLDLQTLKDNFIGKRGYYFSESLLVDWCKEIKICFIEKLRLSILQYES
jgi:hypothetical protein